MEDYKSNLFNHEDNYTIYNINNNIVDFNNPFLINNEIENENENYFQDIYQSKKKLKKNHI